MRIVNFQLKPKEKTSSLDDIKDGIINYFRRSQEKRGAHHADHFRVYGGALNEREVFDDEDDNRNEDGSGFELSDPEAFDDAGDDYEDRGDDFDDRGDDFEDPVKVLEGHNGGNDGDEDTD